MTHLCDIFQIKNDGPRWVESAESVEDAKARVQELTMQSEVGYLLLDHKTGNKFVIKPNGVAGITRSEVP